MEGETRVSDSKAVRGPRNERDQGREADKRTSVPTFYRQVVAELRKVVWPTQEQLITYFFVVMVFVLVMIAIVAALDLGFGKLSFWVFGGGGTQ
jgi:preprotein translocase subunit SecE